jgi:hypothetical protein
VSAVDPPMNGVSASSALRARASREIGVDLPRLGRYRGH